MSNKVDKMILGKVVKRVITLFVIVCLATSCAVIDTISEISAPAKKPLAGERLDAISERPDVKQYESIIATNTNINKYYVPEQIEVHHIDSNTQRSGNMKFLWQDGAVINKYANKHMIGNDKNLLYKQHKHKKKLVNLLSIKTEDVYTRYSRMPLGYWPTFLPDQIITLNSIGDISSRDIHTGKKMWSANPFATSHVAKDISAHGGISYDDGKIFVSCGASQIASLNVRDGGRLLWSKLMSMPIKSAPLIRDDLLIVQGMNGTLYAINKNNGKILWTNKVWSTGEPQSLASMIPIVTPNGLVIAQDEAGNIIVVDVLSGNLVGEIRVNAYRQYIKTRNVLGSYTSIIDDNVLFMTAFDRGNIIALDVVTGRVMWEKQYSISQSMWAAGGLLFIINDDKNLMAIDQKNGEIVWKHNMPHLKCEYKYKKSIMMNGEAANNVRDVVSNGTKNDGMKNDDGVNGVGDKNNGAYDGTRDDMKKDGMRDDKIYKNSKQNKNDKWTYNELKIDDEKGNDDIIQHNVCYQRTMKHVVYSPPVVIGDRVVIASSDGKLITFDMLTGKLLKEFDIAEIEYIGVLAYKENLYMLTEKGDINLIGFK